MKPYESVLAIAKTYLGPAAESFLKRQLQVGMQLEAAQLTKAHFKELAKWLEVAACRFIERAKAEEMAKRIAIL
jgi:hypothetical protein